MTRIGLLSDTHGWLDEQVLTHFANCDEIWHAGDFGEPDIIPTLQQYKPVKAVYGNVDPAFIRYQFPEKICFTVEQVTVCMQHIGGYPGRYAPGVKNWLQQSGAQLFISGHSHILKVQYDTSIDCLHINPGAAGRHGWHQVRTIVRFAINGQKIEQLEVIELGKRGR
jgi:putative phosphoesterase